MRVGDSSDRPAFRPLPQRFRPPNLRHRPPARLQSLHQAHPGERAIRLFAVSVVAHGLRGRATLLPGTRRD